MSTPFSASLSTRSTEPVIRSSLAMTLALILLLSIPCFSQQHAERTIEEIKTEAIHRAEVGQYPLIGLDPGDVQGSFQLHPHSR